MVSLPAEALLLQCLPRGRGTCGVLHVYRHHLGKTGTYAGQCHSVPFLTGLMHTLVWLAPRGSLLVFPCEQHRAVAAGGASSAKFYSSSLKLHPHTPAAFNSGQCPKRVFPAELVIRIIFMISTALLNLQRMNHT